MKQEQDKIQVTMYPTGLGGFVTVNNSFPIWFRIEQRQKYEGERIRLFQQEIALEGNFSHKFETELKQAIRQCPNFSYEKACRW